MSARMELEDLPPRYRAQAEAQIAARSRGKCTSPQAMSAAARAAGKLEKAFESRGEYEYYMGVIVPGIQSGKILKATPHIAFPLLPAKEYGNVKLPAARYTADYVLKYADGTVEVVEIKSRFSGNTIMQKTFPGGHVTIVGANSPAGLASRPIKIVLADEVDRYPVSAGTEGDPLNLAQTRQTTFWDKKTVLVSTPTIKGSSRIEKSWLESTMEEWTVPCPECGEYQPMVWANVVFDRERWPKGGVQYRCESCGCIAGEYRWKAQGRKGRYAALHPEREVRGFHLNVLASSFCAWAGIVTEFLSAKEALDHGNPELMKVWVNTKLGETWEERGETADDMALLARREMYTATVPAQVLVLTCGIDVQDDRFELELVGWGVGKESWGIRYQKIYGDPLKPQIWEDLDKFLQTRWRREDGVVLDILAAAMDTGGHHTDSVYRFCLDRFYRHVYAIKGRGGTETPFVSKPSTGNRVGVPLYTIGVDNGKTMVYQRLNVQTEGPNYCHFPLNEAAGYDEVYFKGLTAEKQVVRWKKGRPTTAWELKDPNYHRNEPLDCRDYALAALEIANPVLENPEEEMETQATQRPAGRRIVSGGIG